MQPIVKLEIFLFVLKEQIILDFPFGNSNTTNVEILNMNKYAYLLRREVEKRISQMFYLFKSI